MRMSLSWTADLDVVVDDGVDLVDRAEAGVRIGGGRVVGRDADKTVHPGLGSATEAFLPEIVGGRLDPRPVAFAFRLQFHVAGGRGPADIHPRQHRGRRSQLVPPAPALISRKVSLHPPRRPAGPALRLVIFTRLGQRASASGDLGVASISPSSISSTLSFNPPEISL